VALLTNTTGTNLKDVSGSDVAEHLCDEKWLFSEKKHIYAVFRLARKGYNSSNTFRLNVQIPVVANPEKIHIGVAA
jgi:hypothetical protein